MTVFSRPIGAALDSANPTVVLKAPPGGIPAGAVICVFTLGDAVFSIADTPGNAYKLANGQGVFLWYAYNTKALRPGDTISVQKYGTMLVKACAFTGLVTSKDPLISATAYGGYNTKPVAPVPAGDLVVMGLEYDGFGPSAHYIEDAAHAWNQYDFARVVADPEVYVDPMFAATLTPRPTGSFNWSPQVIPTAGGWVIIAAAFSAVATVALTPVGLAVGSPSLVPGGFSIFGKVTPIGITTASPFIGAPSTVVDAPQVVVLTYRDRPDIMEALFTNLNTALSLELQPHSLVGRSEDDVGAAQRILVVPPLLLVDKTLTFDPSFMAGTLDAIYARLAAVETEAAAATAGLALLSDHVSALTDIVDMLAEQVSALQIQVKFLNRSISIGQGAIDLAVASPVFGTPTAT